MLYKNPRPHPLTPSPAGEGELNLLLPSPGGRGVGGEGETLHKSGFHVKLTPLGTAMPLPAYLIYLKYDVNICYQKSSVIYHFCFCFQTKYLLYFEI
ncbi:hypothetical protein FDUTEX481_03870 [Tolypothrix sp. PCC 7601]|nr:hypothetical protein FDUTEX481_03870 [Tolypothrix sp. PCC 7601]